MHRWTTSLLLAGAMLLPVAAARADDHDDRWRAEHRAYRQEQAQRQWTRAEQRAYRQYQRENRMRYRSWSRANNAQRQAYWNWRANHPEFDRHTR